jgi:hypothetical protein
MEIHPVGADLFRADGQTDMTKVIVTFCNFAKSPKIYIGLFNVIEYLFTELNFQISCPASYTNFFLLAEFKYNECLVAKYTII